MTITYFNKYPELMEQLETLCRTRRNEILQTLVDNDAFYNTLRRKRTEYSIILKDALGAGYGLLEDYTNAVYAQESYELDAIYRQGIFDTLELLTENKLL